VRPKSSSGRLKALLRRMSGAAAPEIPVVNDMTRSHNVP
jgi:hypothetical protein